MKISLGVEYDGTAFKGFQTQHGLRTIQTELEQALSKVADDSIQVFCAGRTDAGVHAFGQVIHFETDAVRPDRAWVLGTNTHLPNDVVVQWAQSVPEDFHARFSAIKRHYRYVIYNANIPSAIHRHYAAYYAHALNTDAMQKAANYLIGEHDFSSFRCADCQSKTPFREVFSINVSKQNKFIVIDVSANAFLHHMVRNVVGALLVVGSGRQPIEWMNELLNACNRDIGYATAPSCGLYFMSVEYPPQFILPLNHD